MSFYCKIVIYELIVNFQFTVRHIPTLSERKTFVQHDIADTYAPERLDSVAYSRRHALDLMVSAVGYRNLGGQPVVRQDIDLARLDLGSVRKRDALPEFRCRIVGQRFRQSRYISL